MSDEHLAMLIGIPLGLVAGVLWFALMLTPPVSTAILRLLTLRAQKHKERR